MDVGQMLDGIVKYEAILKQHGFDLVGDGTLPWSHRFVHADGTYVERNASKWEMRTAQDELIDEGRNQDDLFIAFKMIYG